MAVAFDAVGPSSSGTASVTSPLTWTHACGAGATVLLVGVTCDAATDTGMVLSATYNAVAMTSLGLRHSNDQTAGYLQVFSLDSPPSGSHSVSVTEAGGSGLGGLDGGSISFTGSATVSVAQTAAGSGTTASLAFSPSSPGNMVAAFAGCGSALTPSGSFTSRFNENAGSGQAAAGYAAGSTIAGGGSVTASWTSASDWWAVIAVEVQAPAGAAPAVPQAVPGRTWLRRFRHRQALPAPPPPSPAGVASLAGAGTLAVVATVAAPAALAGAGALSASAVPCITGLGGSGAGYFIDTGGTPRMVLGDAAWGLPGNAGRWNSGNWQADFDGYLATRAGQRFNVIYTKPMGTTQNGGINDDGRTFDSLFPFQGGAPSTGTSGANPSSGLTSAYWARIDYFLNSALAKGVTVFLNAIGYSSDFDSGPGPLAGKSSTEFGAYGTALGARYASQPNLVWMVADDYFGGAADTKISAFLTALRAAGDAHVISIENYPETTSRKDLPGGGALAWGTSNAQFSFVYSYNVTYYGVEKAYLESSPIPVIWGDGYFYQGGNSGSYQGGTGAFAYDHAARQDAWHAVSSAARGWVNGSEGIWQYQSTALADSALEWWYVHNAGAIRAFAEALPGWHLLTPDTSSALVTAGRGTHASSLSSGGGGGQYEVAFTDAYVTASRGPDSGSGASLALIYMSHGSTITIDQSKMVAGYTATWVDPVTLATSSATPGSTYNSTAKGSNSAGEADWALVLQAPPVVSGTASLAGAGSVAAPVTQASAASPAGAGSVSAPVVQAATVAASGAGSLSSPVVQAAVASLAGAGSVTAAVGGGQTASLSGAGSVSAVAVVIAPCSPAGAGALSAPVAVAAPAQLSGTGSSAALAVTQASASPSGAAAVAAGGLARGPFTTGTLTASDAPSGTLTTATQATGGPS